MFRPEHQLKKADCNVQFDEIEKKVFDYDNHKFDEIEKKIFDYDKYITTIRQFNKSTGSFTARLKETKLATKDDVADFVKDTDFDEKPIKINIIVTSNNRSLKEARWPNKKC